jgi:hypothetical protein
METTTTDPRLTALRAMPYARYLATPEWRRRRDRALQAAHWRCQWPDCRARDGLAVHHRSYEHLGEERDADLRVLCPRHHQGVHEQLATALRLHWRVIRDVIHSGPFADFAEFVDTVKRRLAALHIVISVADLHELLSVSLREVPLEIPARQPAVSPTAGPWISEAEARGILAELGLGRVMHPMPTTYVPVEEDDFEAARERAWEMGIELER